MVVTLKHEVDMVLVEDRHPERRAEPACRARDATGRPDDERARISTLPSRLAVIASSHDACRRAWACVADGHRAIEHDEASVSALEAINQVGVDAGRPVVGKLEEWLDTVAGRDQGIHGYPRKASAARDRRRRRPSGRNGPSWSARCRDRPGRRPARESRHRDVGDERPSSSRPQRSSPV